MSEKENQIESRVEARSVDFVNILSEAGKFPAPMMVMGLDATIVSDAYDRVLSNPDNDDLTGVNLSKSSIPDVQQVLDSPDSEFKKTDVICTLINPLLGKLSDRLRALYDGDKLTLVWVNPPVTASSNVRRNAQSRLQLAMRWTRPTTVITIDTKDNDKPVDDSKSAERSENEK